MHRNMILLSEPGDTPGRWGERLMTTLLEQCWREWARNSGSALSPQYGGVHVGYWRVTNRADPVACSIADRHYTRQKPGSSQFVPPGRCLVLITDNASALWVTSFPFAEYVKHEWAGAWICSLFRNEGHYLSSALIREAVALTYRRYGEPPSNGMVTFINRGKVRRKRDYGRCFLRAGFAVVGETKGGLLALQASPEVIRRIVNDGQTADTSRATADARRSAGEHSASCTRLADARGDADGTSNRKERGKACTCGDDEGFVVGDAEEAQQRGVPRRAV